MPPLAAPPTFPDRETFAPTASYRFSINGEVNDRLIKSALGNTPCPQPRPFSWLSLPEHPPVTCFPDGQLLLRRDFNFFLRTSENQTLPLPSGKFTGEGSENWYSRCIDQLRENCLYTPWNSRFTAGEQASAGPRTHRAPPCGPPAGRVRGSGKSELSRRRGPWWRSTKSCFFTPPTRLSLITLMDSRNVSASIVLRHEHLFLSVSLPDASPASPEMRGRPWRENYELSELAAAVRVERRREPLPQSEKVLPRQGPLLRQLRGEGPQSGAGQLREERVRRECDSVRGRRGVRLPEGGAPAGDDLPVPARQAEDHRRPARVLQFGRADDAAPRRVLQAPASDQDSSHVLPEETVLAGVWPASDIRVSKWISQVLTLFSAIFPWLHKMTVAPNKSALGSEVESFDVERAEAFESWDLLTIFYRSALGDVPLPPPTPARILPSFLPTIRFLTMRWMSRVATNPHLLEFGTFQVRML